MVVWETDAFQLLDFDTMFSREMRLRQKRQLIFLRKCSAGKARRGVDPDELDRDSQCRCVLTAFMRKRAYPDSDFRFLYGNVYKRSCVCEKSVIETAVDANGL